jgi:F-type H+-transporting ATPase subunit O
VTMLSSFVRNVASRRYAVEMTRRGFSDASSHKPLVDLHGIHARYANAAYIAASKTGNLEKVEQELLAIKATAKSNATFAEFLANPLIARDEKVRQIETLLAKKTTPTTLNLMTTLAGNARLVELEKVIDTYGLLMKAKRGQIEATIISAEPLTKSQTDTVQKAIMNQLKGDKSIVISSKVDPSIIGGLQVQIGDKFLDLSVASRIDTISRIPL